MDKRGGVKMYAYGIKKRGDDFLFWLIIVVIVAVPAIPCVALWLHLSPATFWQKLILFVIIVLIVYPLFFAVEILILKLLE